MKKLKSERHHWWPECVSRHWAAEDGKTGWLKPDGTCVRIPPARLGVIGNAHHIKMGVGGESSPWDVSFERAFDKADSGFPELIKWLEQIERKPMSNFADLTQRFTPQKCDDEKLMLMTECAVSLAIRGPRNREASVALAEHLRGPIAPTERNALIGMNMIHSQRRIADSIGARGKFVAIYSEDKEFIFGDGFFHNIAGPQAPLFGQKLFVPITPYICLLLCRPSNYIVEPKFMTLILNHHEVDLCNQAVQVYSKNAIYFRSQKPVLLEEFRSATHLRYQGLQNPIDNIIHFVPGILAKNLEFNRIYSGRLAEESKHSLTSRLKHLLSKLKHHSSMN